MGHVYDRYDETLTQGLWNTFHTSSQHTYYSWSLGSRSTLSVTGSADSSSQTEGEDTDYNYHNFRAITGVDFTVTFGGSSASVPSTFDCDENTSMTNVTLAGQGVIAGDNVKLGNLTFTKNGGWVAIAGSGAALNGMTAKQDFGDFEIYGLPSGSASAADVTVSRRLSKLVLGQSLGSSLGSGISADKITVRGKLDSVCVAGGALLTSLTVGLDRSWGAADVSAFAYYDSGWGSWTHSSATHMTVASGGSAANIFLGNGGWMEVEGPGWIYSSSLVSSAGNSWYETTSSKAVGTGGVIENLQMATVGGLQFDGVSDPRATWEYPRNGYANSSSYMSGFIATAPQSSYLSLGEFTSARNVEIGNGGSMNIASGASAVNVSMGALVTSTFFTNSSGGTDLWIGDRGAKLTINGGYASNVQVEAANMTFEYYSAAYDYFWLYSSSIQHDYYESHGSYAPAAQVSASALAGYRNYMSGQYISGTHYTQLGSDGGYARQYVGGDVAVNTGVIENLSGFADLDVTHYGTSETVSGSFVYSAYAIENVSKASGRISATIRVGGGAHLTSVTAPGGLVIMGYDGKGVYRMTGQENPQSNFARIEHLDLRTSGLVGDHNSAVIIFEDYLYGTGTISMPVLSNGSQVYDSEGWPQYNYFGYDCKDPGEIVYVSADKNLVVKGSYGTFTYLGSGAVTINALGTIRNEQYESRYYSSAYFFSESRLHSTVTRWLDPAVTHYEFGVVKGVYDEENGKLQAATILDGSAGFDWKGVLAVGSGAVVTGVGSKAGLFTANTLTSDSWNPVIEQDVSKMLYVLAGGSADNVTVTGRVTNFERTSTALFRSNAALLVSSGGTATNVSILSGGIAMAQGGTIDGVFVGAGGILYLSGWGGAIQVSDDGGETIAGPQHLDTTVLNGVRLDSGGQLAAVYDYLFGGKTPGIIANTGGGILNGVTANGVAYASGVDFAGNMTLAGGQQGIDLTVRGFTTVTSRDSAGNPTAYNTTIGTLNVSSGGIVKGATVGDEGAIYVSEGADVSSLTASGGRVIFEHSGSSWGDYLPGSATVTGIGVLDGGILEVNSKFALSAANMRIGESAGLEVDIVRDADEDHARTELGGTWSAAWGSGTFRTQNGVLSGFGGQFGYEYLDPIYSSAYTSARLSMTFLNGGALSGGDLRGYGSIRAFSGGRILDTRLQGITANIGAGGYASGLSAAIERTGSAYDTNIYVYGSGALAENTVLSGGFISVENGGFLSGVTMLAPSGYEGPAGDAHDVGPAEMEITAGGVASSVIAGAGVITMYEGSKDPGTASPTLSDAEVRSAATLIIKCDGAVLDGTLTLGGTVNTTSTRYEWIEVEVTDPDTGDSYTDWERIEKNNATANAATLTVDFDLTERKGSDTTVMIDNLANLSGATLRTITVSAEQSSGKYVLAKGAEAFHGSLTLICGGKTLGTLSVGATVQISDALSCSLANSTDGGLVFTVASDDPGIADIQATVDGTPLADGTWTNRSVNIKAVGNSKAKTIWYRVRSAAPTRSSGDEGSWLQLNAKTGLTVSEYCIVDLKAKFANGKFSEIVSYTVNYDDSPAEISELQFTPSLARAWYDTGDECTVSARVIDDLDASPVVELLADGALISPLALDENGRCSFTVTGNGDYQLRATDHAGNVTITPVNVDFYDVPAVTATTDGVRWEGRDGVDCRFSIGDGSGGSLGFRSGDGVVSFCNLPPRTFSVQVGYVTETGTASRTVTREAGSGSTRFEAVTDGITDLIFAYGNSRWNAGYAAQHTGTLDGWTGTNELVSLGLKNRVADLFVGSDDAHVLLLTDDAKGDALFIDDVYSALPDDLPDQARLSQIREIRAGAGNDVVDLTSQRFAYTNGVTVYGGDGNDVIWANTGDNRLFGDAGNDRIIGAAGDDLIVGGIGNDRMHGGGGNDVFTFCENWGTDTVQQLAGGTVTLWFASGLSDNWDASTLTYSDGTNSVTVSGITAENITLKFGDTSPDYAALSAAGAFTSAASEKIFEDPTRGMIA